MPLHGMSDSKCLHGKALLIMMMINAPPKPKLSVADVEATGIILVWLFLDVVVRKCAAICKLFLHEFRYKPTAVNKQLTIC